MLLHMATWQWVGGGAGGESNNKPQLTNLILMECIIQGFEEFLNQNNDFAGLH